MHHIKYKTDKIRIIIQEVIYVLLLSIIVFSIILKEIPLNIYITIYVLTIFLILIVLYNKSNAIYLPKIMLIATSITAGYAFEKIFIVHSSFMTFLQSFEYDKYRWFLLISIMTEYLYVFLVYVYNLKDNRTYNAIKACETCSNSSKEEACDNSQQPELYREREYDLQRISQYIVKFDTVGIQGSWGSGKTYIVDEYIRRNCDQYEVIKIEALTCNLDTIDSYMFKQLEYVLWHNGIYPRYSRRILSWLKSNNVLAGLKTIISKDESDSMTAFEGFCHDIRKLDKPILLVCEDIDRISENYAGQISKILDIATKLSGNNVKVLYEYDQLKMTSLGFDKDYMEKYIPYVVNLTDIAFMELVEESLKEEAMQKESRLNGGLCKEDFRFLSLPIHMDYYLQQIFEFKSSFEIQLKNIEPRKIKEFVSEVNLTMKNSIYAAKENKKVAIVFCYIKIFMWESFNSISFNDEFYEDVTFERRITKDGISKVYHYNIIELINMVIDKRITKEEIIHLFTTDNHEQEEKYVMLNRNKLGVLLLMNFDFKSLKYMYDRKTASNDRHKGLNRNPILDEDMNYAQRMERNHKINQLINNLYMNGRSEYTDSEAAARLFIDDVLLPCDKCQAQGKTCSEWLEDSHSEVLDKMGTGRQEKNCSEYQGKNWTKCQEMNWTKYQKKCFDSNIYKDNNTIHMWMGDDYLSLAKAMRTIVNMSQYNGKRSIIKKSFFDFWENHMVNDKNITLEKIQTFRLLEPESNDVFIKAITLFNTLSVSGNMNTEKIYTDFLDTYLSIACRLGYIHSYMYYHELKGIESLDDKKGEILKTILSEIIRHVKKDMDDGYYPASVEGNVLIFKKFIDTNLAIIDDSDKKTWSEPTFTTSISENTQYTNKTVYDKLNTLAKKAQINKDNYRKLLDEEYDNGNLNMAEYYRLMKEYENQLAAV